jgi:hypothetical protein
VPACCRRRAHRHDRRRPGSPAPAGRGVVRGRCHLLDPARLGDRVPAVHPSRAAFRARSDDGDRTRYTGGSRTGLFRPGGPDRECGGFRARRVRGSHGLGPGPDDPDLRSASLTPGFWSFTFAYAAAASDVLVWLAITKPTGATGSAIAVIALLTAFVSWIAFRTVIVAVRGQLFPARLPADRCPKFQRQVRG